MHTGVIAAGVIITVYFAWKNGYLKFKESYTQIPGNVFGNIENPYAIPSDLAIAYGKTEGFENGTDMAEGGNSELTDNAMRSGIDKSVVESHQKYVEDISMLATLGPSKASVRSDYRPVVTQWGLPRSKPAETIPLDDARQTNSEPNEHLREYMYRNTSFKL